MLLNYSALQSQNAETGPIVVDKAACRVSRRSRVQAPHWQSGSKET